jgi:hypothetical protein
VSGLEDLAMRLAFGAPVAVAATLLVAGCEDRHDHDRYGGYTGGGYAGYPGGYYGGDEYDSYDDWRYRTGRDYGCDAGGCPYYYSARRDGCYWRECSDPGRQPVVIYDRSRRQYVYVFVPRDRYRAGGAGRDDDRSGRGSAWWGRPDRDDRQRNALERQHDDNRRDADDDRLRRRQRDADEQARRQDRDRDTDANRQRQNRDRDADRDRARGDRPGSQGRDQDRGGQGDRGGRDRDQHCIGRNCSS